MDDLKETPSKEELLKYAALAADVDYDPRFCAYYDGGQRPWNPIEESEDAFNLAVKLDIKVIHFPSQGFVVADHKTAVWYKNFKDKYAATRMVVTLAAYYRGKRLK